jgi:3-deoxy-D-manno-octulosonic acid (KDO) 8-phosphate synthase
MIIETHIDPDNAWSDAAASDSDAETNFIDLKSKN